MPQPENVLAHWKFQNLEGCYQGDIETDELTFFDLSGNGNDLISVFEGNGYELDVFTWDTGVTGENSSSLKFNNTLVLAESVDPYNKSQTTYSGAYVSGKYLKTKASAPMNFMENTREWTIEIVFKISSEWNNSYNRYSGIFSRQGINTAQDEPLFLMAVGESNDAVKGVLGRENTADLQFVHFDETQHMTKKAFGNIYSEEWVHYMAVGDQDGVAVYLNGEDVYTQSINVNFAWSEYGWEVGVGRKHGKDAVTMNTPYPEGLIRRLFCGSISEIRFSLSARSIEESLWNQVKQ